MEPKARILRGAVYLATVASLLAIAPGARAADGRRVVIGEVATRVTRARLDLAKALRRALERELATLDVGAKRSADRYVLSASLVRLEARKPGASGVTCAV